jgi:hypothetical protein
MEAPLSVLSKNIAESRARNMGRMADLMVEKTIAAGACTEQDLLNAGFTWPQIAVLSVDAKRSAAETLRDRNFEAIA